ncbi:MAG: hypothetical protein JWO96_25 [Candidatus Saccharibacteria bacterium]|nr:hypothetical protein [Candidatus Saccharibacteria bacterium]
MADILLGILIFVPALLTFFLKSNGAVIFLAVCAGYVASSLAGTDVANLLSNSNFKVRNTDVYLIFLFLPMAFSIFLTALAVTGKPKLIMHTIAAAAAGAVFVLAAAPFINISLHLNLTEAKSWHALSGAQSYLAGGGALYSMILIWFFSKNSSKKHKK